MLTLSKKHILECQKKLSKIFGFIYPQSKRVCKVSLETDNFYGVRKKDNNCHVKYLIFSTKICLFYARHTARRFIVKRLYGHVAYEDVRADFLFRIC
jgi:hypothetical protein